jgi:hypothetical protein
MSTLGLLLNKIAQSDVDKRRLLSTFQTNAGQPKHKYNVWIKIKIQNKNGNILTRFNKYENNRQVINLSEKSK